MATFPSVNPWYAVRKIPMFQTYIVEYGNMVEQRIALNSAERWQFQLDFNFLTPTDADSIIDFFIARKGAYESFSWLNPEDSQTYTVRFKEDLINIDYFSYQLYALKQVTFIEVSA